MRKQVTQNNGKPGERVVITHTLNWENLATHRRPPFALEREVLDSILGQVESNTNLPNDTASSLLCLFLEGNDCYCIAIR